MTEQTGHAMKIATVIMAESNELPPIGEAMYQYVVAGNGLFVRAEDSRMEACVMIAPAECHGLAMVAAYARLKVDRVPGIWLHSVLVSALRNMPNEAMYQFVWDGQAGKFKPEAYHTWRCVMPGQVQSPTSVKFDDDGESVVDLHSHNSMAAFFSATDDDDEQGLRFYAVIGKLGTWKPEISVRVGVYGHFMDVPAEVVFDNLGPFTDQYAEEYEEEESEGSDQSSEVSSQSSEEDEQRDLIEAWHERLVG